MDENSTTDAADNQTDQQNADNQADQGKATTDNQNDANKGDDNLDSSKSTDTSADDDKSNKTDEEEDNSSASKFDDDLDEWAKKTNRAVPTTDGERKLLQEIRDGQRDFSRQQEAKKAAAAVQDAMKDTKPADNKQDDEDGEDDDPLAKEVAELKASNSAERTARLQSEYFSTHPVSAEESKVMGEILKEKVDKGGKAAYDYWTNPDNLEDWHALAKARLAATTDTTAIEQEAARKERERIAKESNANGPSRNASTQQPQNKKGYNRTEFLKSDD
jgi:hypothetical protein